MAMRPLKMRIRPMLGNMYTTGMRSELDWDDMHIEAINRLVERLINRFGAFYDFVAPFIRIRFDSTRMSVYRRHGYKLQKISLAELEYYRDELIDGCATEQLVPQWKDDNV